MNSKIKALENKIENLKKQSAEAVSKVEAEIQKLLNPIFEADSDLQADKTKLENFQVEGYLLEEDGFVSAWVRAESIEKYKNFQHFLSVYLEVYHCDFEHSTLQNSLGDAILINTEDGGIYLNQDCIIEADSYETEPERNSLIEAYMEREGYFPGVFEADRYGNIYSVDTKPENPKQGVSK